MEKLKLSSQLSSTLSFHNFFDLLAEQAVEEGSYQYLFKPHLQQELLNHPEWREDIKHYRLNPHLVIIKNEEYLTAESFFSSILWNQEVEAFALLPVFRDAHMVGNTA